MDSGPLLDDRYRRYAELLLSHHSLLAGRSNDGDELQAIEDEMTQLWDNLDADQKHSLSGLGSDLNWIRRKGQSAPRATPADRVTDGDIQWAINASGRGDWHDALHHLRICGAKLPPAQVARLRSDAWQQLGFPQISQQFASFAAELDRNSLPLSLPITIPESAARTKD